MADDVVTYPFVELEVPAVPFFELPDELEIVTVVEDAALLLAEDEAAPEDELVLDLDPAPI